MAYTVRNLKDNILLFSCNLIIKSRLYLNVTLIHYNHYYKTLSYETADSLESCLYWPRTLDFFWNKQEEPTRFLTLVIQLERMVIRIWYNHTKIELELPPTCNFTALVRRGRQQNTARPYWKDPYRNPLETPKLKN